MRITAVAGGAALFAALAVSTISTQVFAAEEARPVLPDAEAGKHTVLNYFAQSGQIAAPVTDNWNPTAGVKIDGVKADFVVDKAGAIKTVQAAISAAALAVQQGKKTATDRQYILVKPGTYAETVLVPDGVTITLFGEAADASKTVITQKAWGGSSVAEYQALANPEGKVFVKGTTPDSVMDIYDACAGRMVASIGPTCSATVAVRGDGFEARNLSFVNDFDESSTTIKKKPAVALLVDGADKSVFENVRVIGNEFTLYAKSQTTDTINRTYFKGSYVEGDVDVIVGRSTAVFDKCELHYVASRTMEGTFIAPSTAAKQNYGFLIINSKFTADASVKPGAVALGHSWDEGRNTKDKPYEHGVSPNGQAVVRESELGSHINQAAPWTTAASTNRRFSKEDTRFAEYRNTGAAQPK